MSWFSWIVTIALLFQPCNTLTASEIAPAACSAPIHAADIALKRGGTLQGQVVDGAGVGIGGVLVELTQCRQHWQTKTDAQGWFQVAGLRGGTYQFRAAGQTQLVRVWTPGTAPPRASRGMLVLPSTDIVRGQRVVSPNTNQFFRVAKQRLANPWIFGGVVATAVAIPVAIHNGNDSDPPPATP